MKPTIDIALRFRDKMDDWFYLLARIDGRRFGCVGAPDMSRNQLHEMIGWLGSALDAMGGAPVEKPLVWEIDGEAFGFYDWTLSEIGRRTAVLTVSDGALDAEWGPPNIILPPTLIDLPLFIRRFWQAFRDWGAQSDWSGIVAPVAAEKARRDARHRHLHESGYFDRQMEKYGHCKGAPDIELWMEMEARWRRCAHLDPARYRSPRLDAFCGIA